MLSSSQMIRFQVHVQRVILFRITAPGSLIDPKLHACGSVRLHGAAELSHPQPGFCIAGMKSWGRAPAFLLATGHKQMRSIAAQIAGDHLAAAHAAPAILRGVDQ